MITRHRKHIAIILLTILLAVYFSNISSAQQVAIADTCQTTNGDLDNMPFHKRLLKEFPVIYNDTAYTDSDYHILLRAVWMSQKKRKVRVTLPEPLPVTQNSALIRFIPGCMKQQ